MDRREFLSRAACAALPLALTSTRLFGQQPGPPAVAGAAPQNNEEPPAPPLDPRVDAILRNWEQRSSTIERLNGTFQRYVYDSVFGVEKRSNGQFYYQAPDRGRLDFIEVKKSELPVPAVNQLRKTMNGTPFNIVSDTPQRWVCTGQAVLVIDDSMKTVQRIQIPPHFQGQNIADGPLPFLFGMKADKAVKRYGLTIGKKHSQQVYHLVAKPKLQYDAQEWCQAEVMLDPETFLPAAIRTIDPAGTKDTVYVFDKGSLSTNSPLFAANPFDERKLGIGSYNVLQVTTAEAPPEAQKTVPKSVLR